MNTTVLVSWYHPPSGNADQANFLRQRLHAVTVMGPTVDQPIDVPFAVDTVNARSGQLLPGCLQWQLSGTFRFPTTSAPISNQI